METDVVKQLNLLLKRHYDAEKGYRQASELIKNKELESFFTNNAVERYRFGHEIKGILGDLGAKPDKGSSLEGDTHRLWMNIREKLALNDDKAVLEECERGEEHAVKDYSHALDSLSLKPEHKEKLSEHLHSIRNSLEQVRKLAAMG